MGNMDHLSYFIHNPFWMFLGGIVMKWRSSSLSTTAIIALVASGAVPVPTRSSCGGSMVQTLEQRELSILLVLSFLMVCRRVTHLELQQHTLV